MRLTTTKLKKPHPFRLVGWVQMWSGLVSHPHVVDKNLGGISWKSMSPTTTTGPQLRVPVPGKCLGNKEKQFLITLRMGLRSSVLITLRLGPRNCSHSLEWAQMHRILL